MLKSEALEIAVRPQLAAAPNATQVSSDHSIPLSLDHLLRHSRIEPLIRKLFPDQRRFERIVLPNVVAYLGRAHKSRPHQIGNISVGGFCLVSDEQWTTGTEMPITLQREEWDGEESSECISVQAIVARCERGEVGFSIALTPEESIAFSMYPENRLWAGISAMEQFLDKLKKPKPARHFPVDCPRERPLSLTERSERLLEIAKLYNLSPASELWFTENR
jgi:hypothetical protein